MHSSLRQAIITALLSPILFALTASTSVTAQGSRVHPASKSPRTVHRAPTARPGKTAQATAATQSIKTEQTPAPAQKTPVPPVSVVPPPDRPEFLFGQAAVTVRGNEDPVVRLGLAKHAPVTVEFPASDNFFTVHPGGSFLVVVDDQVDLKSDHYLTFRAGPGFTPPEEGQPSKPIAKISVQMASGMFVTFMFYPVRYVDQAVDRCIVSYSRDEVISARRAVGLAVNLNSLQTLTPDPTNASLRATGPALSAQASAKEAIERNTSQSSGDKDAATPRSARYLLMRDGDNKVLRANRSGAAAGVDFVAESRRALARAVEQPGKFREWSGAVNGLRISALPAVEFDPQRRLSVIAVRNVTTAPLRLLPDQPAMDLEMIGDGGQVMQLKTIDKIFTDTTSLAGALPAGATVYYAVVYEPPVLDRRQRVRLTFAHSEAADEAATSAITTAAAAADRRGK